uniref:Uncharacterized protein n=1 Tax=Solanum lycopersicum TaxID=4081 RepID=A0A3Q7F9S7_SOLLC
MPNLSSVKLMLYASNGISLINQIGHLIFSKLVAREIKDYLLNYSILCSIHLNDSISYRCMQTMDNLTMANATTSKDDCKPYPGQTNR